MCCLWGGHLVRRQPLRLQGLQVVAVWAQRRGARVRLLGERWGKGVGCGAVDGLEEGW